MNNPFSFFGTEGSGPHISVAAEKVLQIGPLAVSNSLLYGWVSAAIIITLLVTIARRAKIRPLGGIVQFVEMGASFVIGLLESSLGNRQKAVKYAPLFCSIFFFVLLNIWLGLLPGVGPAIKIHGAPVFRPFTADLNGTLGLAITAIITVQAIAIKESGGMKHLEHYFGGNFKNPINIFVGLLEMFGELTRVVSLSLRLFFNILIGEILISIFTFLGKLAAPITTLPFITMEIFVGLVQAYIFTMLCATYLGIATAHDEHNNEQHSEFASDQLAKPKKFSEAASISKAVTRPEYVTINNR